MTHFFAPGPIRIPDCLKEDLSTTAPYFAGKEFSKILERIQPRLKEVFGTQNPVMIGTGSGSLGMESVVSNFFEAGDLVVVIITGKYGMNWSAMCRRRGLEVVEIVVPDGMPISGEKLEGAMSSGSSVAGVFITHVDTTTGVLNDVDGLREIIRKYPQVLIVVDAVCSLLSEHLVSSDYDVVISASQKALSLPPGLFFMTASPFAMTVASTITERSFYFDVLREGKRAIGNTTTFTPASNLIMALDTALAVVVDFLGGPKVVIEKNRERAEYARHRLEKAGLTLWSKSPSNAVTAISNSNSSYIVSKLEEEDIIVGSGVRELVGKIFRIMHFGWDLEFEELEFVLDRAIHFSNPYP